MVKKHNKIKLKIFGVILICLPIAMCGQISNNIKKVLKVKEILYSEKANLLKVSELLEAQTEMQAINVLNWNAFKYQPEVKFRIAHSNNQIWIKYYVKEKSIRAVVTQTNGSVHNDSCVEFFFDPMADGNYYNFEFSCIGTTHLGYGSGRGKGILLKPERIDEEILISSTLGETPFEEKSGNFTWEMTIVIPASILTHNKGIQLKGLKTKANFYKCGDKSAEPHFLSWNAIDTERPDFHRPEFFGTVVFE